MRHSEFAASPSNFAHFWLAHVFPLVRELQRAGVHEPFQNTSLRIWHGANRVFSRWAPVYEDLLGPGARCTLELTRRASTPAEHETRRRAFGCAVWVPSIAVHQWAFRNRTFYAATDAWRAFALVMRRTFRSRGAPPGAPSADQLVPPSPSTQHVAVLLRERRVRVVRGLERACDDAWSRTALAGLPPVSTGRRTMCVSLDGGARSTMLSRAAHVLRDARGLVAGHGSGLATLPFLPSTAALVEVDSINNAARARNMYVHIARALGLHATKVWLNDTGTRFCPRRVIACTAAGGGASIHGCAVGYTQNVTLPATVLRDVLRDVFVGAAPRDCGTVLDEQRGRRWWNIDEEMHRLF